MWIGGLVGMCNVKGGVVMGQVEVVILMMNVKKLIPKTA